METRDDSTSTPIRRRSAMRRTWPSGSSIRTADVRVPLWGAAAATLAAFGLGLGVTHVVGAWSSDSTITVHGSVTLLPGAYAPNGYGTCIAGAGYSDISAGTAVTIGDQTGATIAVGQLQGGLGKGDSSGCVFAFDVQAPAGRTSYTVTVSHRGTQVFSAAQAQEANLVLGG